MKLTPSFFLDCRFKCVEFNEDQIYNSCMKNKITKKEALAFKSRWEIVNNAERQELRKTPVVQKLYQLTTLMGWVKDFGWDETLKTEESEVRERWIKLKRLYRV